MQRIALRYAQWFNWRQGKSGHLFQGRYKAILVQADEYLKELAAYIHLNPVRAHIVNSPEKYKWSSHRAYLGKATLPWLETDFICPLNLLFIRPQKSTISVPGLRRFLVGQGHNKSFHGERNIDKRLLGVNEEQPHQMHKELFHKDAELRPPRYFRFNLKPTRLGYKIFPISAHYITSPDSSQRGIASEPDSLSFRYVRYLLQTLY